MTGCPLPAALDGCCHWDIDLTGGSDRVVVVTEKMTVPLCVLGVDLSNLAGLLDSLAVPYRRLQDSILLKIDDLPLPEIYGRPTENALPGLPEVGAATPALSGGGLLDWGY